MVIPREELTPTDYKLLDFIARRNEVSKEQIHNRLHREITDIDYRLSLLLKTDSFVLAGHSYADYESSYITELDGLFRCNPVGRAVLQDYRIKLKDSNREIWLKSVWMPMLVSIAINLLAIGIKELWPQIQQWVANIL